MAPSASPRLQAAVQAAYLMGSGMWPILHRRSFELVTGRKHDFALASGIVFAIADVRAARGYSRVYLGDVLRQAVFAPTWLRPWNRMDGTPGTR
ncbi:MAG TPA: hypothetical protein VFT94_08640 [Gaiellaceae bacterium]|nr:hypothetical protein [Gaiellaceae bacterium]